MSGQTLAAVVAWAICMLAASLLASYYITRAIRSLRAKEAAWEEQVADDFNDHVESMFELVGTRRALYDVIAERMAATVADEWAAINEKGWTA